MEQSAAPYQRYFPGDRSEMYVQKSGVGQSVASYQRHCPGDRNEMFLCVHRHTDIRRIHMCVYKDGKVIMIYLGVHCNITSNVHQVCASNL